MAVATLLTPQQPFPNSGSGRPVTAAGTYDAAGQVLVDAAAACTGARATGW